MATRARARRCSLCGKNHAKADQFTRDACAAASLELYGKKVETLKEQFGASTTFQKVMDYFIANFAKDPTFLGMGELMRDDRVALALAHVTGKLLGRSDEDIEVQLMRLPEHGMTHGLLRFEGGFGLVFFFHDLEKGLLGLNDVQEHEATIYVRFHVHELPDRHDQVLH